MNKNHLIKSSLNDSTVLVKTTSIEGCIYYDSYQFPNQFRKAPDHIVIYRNNKWIKIDIKDIEYFGFQPARTPHDSEE